MISEKKTHKIDPLFAPLIPAFMVELRKRRDILSDVLNIGDKKDLKKIHWEQMQAVSHKIAGSSAPFGFSELSVLGKTLENAIIDSPDNQAEIFKSLRTLVNACEEVLRDHQDQAPEPEPAPAVTPYPVDQINREIPLILLADDDAVIRGMMNSMLTPNYTLISCETAQRCYELAIERNPDLILLDDQMPGDMSGLMLLSKLKDNPKTACLPVFMLTANSKADSVKKAISLGSVDYIIKPLNSDRVLSRIETFLENKDMSVLIVDDDKNIMALLKQQFQSIGMTVITEEHGKHALSLIKQKKPSLVILDRNIPGFNGPQILEGINESTATRDIPVVFLTASDEEEDVCEGLKQGAVDYILKPFKPKEVVERCLKIINNDKSDDSSALSHLLK